MEHYVTLTELMNSPGFPAGADTAIVRKALDRAENAVDQLTFHKIRHAGFSALSTFQQDRIKQAVIELACFNIENADVLSSPFQSYSINGVSMTFGGPNVLKIQGVWTPESAYQLLLSTGLCDRRI